MGITWRITMPLLSTMAALVILVSSAEDHLERDYRYNLRPRALDNPSDYDQAWRAIEAEPMMQPSTQTEPFHESMEEPLKRRRPFRKRKRRPIPDGDSAPVERQVYAEQSVHYQEQVPYSDTTEMPRRRRKKLESRRNQRTEDYVEPERPFRKRGHRKKRPSVNGYRLSEFDDTPQESLDRPVGDDLYNPSPNSEDPKMKEIFQEDYHEGYFETRTEDSERPYATSHDDMQLKEDKSLSEFSMELPKQHNKDDSDEDKTSYLELSMSNKLHDKAQHLELPERPILISSETENSPLKTDISELSLPADVLANNVKKTIKNQMSQAKSRETSTVDAMKIKELLKRSNATSLSEILQQHNLSLADLLNGKTKAISVLKSDDSSDVQMSKSRDSEDTSENREKNESTQDQKESPEDKPGTKTDSEKNTEDTEDSQKALNQKFKEDDLEPQYTGKTHYSKTQLNEESPKLVPKRRFPAGIRRKLRLRPTVKNNMKAELSRDIIIAQTARRYQSNRNNTKSKEWKEILPSMNASQIQPNISRDENTEMPTTISSTVAPEETTIYIEIIPSTVYVETDTMIEINNENESTTDFSTPSTIPTQETTTPEITTTTQKPKVVRLERPDGNRIGSRRQPMQRLKRKRLKQRIMTTEPTTEKDDSVTDDLFNVPNLVSSSEVVAKTQKPPTTNEEPQASEEHATTVNISRGKTKNARKLSRIAPNSTTPKYVDRTVVLSTTEETAKVEIEEILNDTRTSARLSKILMERNMTLSELVEHRERGSSHVHLADIFHNASKEPNPPEPFLSKSSIEPISKETYPLRALLEANLHDPSLKTTTLDPNPPQTPYIPVVMNFGNNVNENNENLGIMSLFTKLVGAENSTINKDSEGTPYVSTVTTVDTTIKNDTTRESRLLIKDNNNVKQDVVAWQKLYELMRQNEKYTSTKNPDLPQAAEELLPTLPSETNDHNVVLPSETNDHRIVEEQSEGDGIIVLEDLENANTEITGRGERLNVVYDRTDTIEQSGVSDKMSANTKSVTVATASIVGLSLILFLLTYAAFKWKQQKSISSQKHNYGEERIQTPVFETRKGHKNNCSTRSISPMLTTSNIYTMNTLESQHSNESAEYMWDSLRKPFQ